MFLPVCALVLSAVVPPSALTQTVADTEALLRADDQVVEITKRLSEIETAFDYVNNDYTGDNPYPWDEHPNKPTLRDRKRALRAARISITRQMVADWPDS